ncbi:acyltransferase [Aeromonas dhakensis]|uniref:acyltransferase n=1 Tax=Aeromonas dhakensis TaxID=196024 RepID=UPI00244D20C2|nr:acyltransferase [Aeromonas dhakensis]
MKHLLLRAKLRFRNKIKVSPDSSMDISPQARVRQCNIFIKGKNNRLIIEKGCNLRNLDIEVLGDDCTLFIGQDTSNTGYGKLSCREQGTRLEIGAGALLAKGITILTSDGHEIQDLDGHRLNQAQNVTIGKNVWIGQDAMILKGATIGEMAVIGARSVVTRHIPSNCIAAGHPAKVLQEGVCWDEKLRSGAQ